MAHHEHLPIYKAGMDLCVYFETITRHFDRHHKYTIGSDLRRLSVKAVMLIIKANDRTKKDRNLSELKDILEEIKIILKIAKEVRAFNSFKSFAVSIRLLDSVLKQ